MDTCRCRKVAPHLRLHWRIRMEGTLVSPSSKANLWWFISTQQMSLRVARSRWISTTHYVKRKKNPKKNQCSDDLLFAIVVIVDCWCCCCCYFFIMCVCYKEVDMYFELLFVECIPCEWWYQYLSRYYQKLLISNWPLGISCDPFFKIWQLIHTWECCSSSFFHKLDFDLICELWAWSKLRAFAKSWALIRGFAVRLSISYRWDPSFRDQNFSSGGAHQE